MLWVCLLVAASACAARAPVSGSSDEGRTSSTRNRDLITQQDLAADPSLRAQSVLDVVKLLRPHFLADHGSNSLQASALSDPDAGKAHASIDNGRIVALAELSGMHGSEILEIRYLNSAQAMQRFGTAARQGPVILVTTIAK
jgi:hypothetical protein